MSRFVICVFDPTPHLEHECLDPTPVNVEHVSQPRSLPAAPPPRAQLDGPTVAMAILLAVALAWVYTAAHVVRAVLRFTGRYIGHG